ncbi:MAG TPA: glycosyltransferase family A protein [Terriglobales bacterium]|nr:glycosyltransferase family A protein [Terriglobales bacterium]
MHSATVSVIIPAYNSERYVADAVKSVLAQSYRPHEIIVVDDGSTDGTAHALEPFAGAIRYLYQQNRGEPAARNTGMRAATGEYIAFLDADDLWVPEKLELQMAYFAAHPGCAFVYSDMSTFDENGLVDASVKVRFNITFPSGNIFPALFHETLFGSGSIVFRRECLLKAGYFDEDFLVGSDYEMWLRMARHYECGVVDKPLLLYRQHPQMSTRGLGRAMRDGVPWEVEALKKILRLYPQAAEELGRAEVKQRLSKPFADMAHTWLQLGEHRQARKLFRQAIAYWPGNWRYWPFYMLTFLTPAQIAGLRKLYGRWGKSPAQDRADSRLRAAL